jgi:hypothetical protein
MTEVASYCNQCGAKIEPPARFCPSCGRATSLAAAPSVARKSISRDRAILAYIMGILIVGTGHMVVGRVARGILILIGALVVGFVAGLIGGLIFILIFGIIYWVLQLIDLYKQIHRMEVVKT